MAFGSPFAYALGFEEALDPDAALEIAHGFGGGWEHTEPGYVDALGMLRTEYRFINTDADGPLSPDDSLAAIEQSDVIRYVVPLYTSEELGSALFSLVPNHVVVSSADLNFMDMAEFDELAEDQGFFALMYRDAVLGGRSRRIYSSLVLEPTIAPPEEYTSYQGEPGAALWLIAEMNASVAGTSVDLVAEPDWYTPYPNDLGTAATRSTDDRPTNDAAES
jgi:hypothetical protein